MRSLPAGLATALPASTTGLARLCTITRRDGLVVRFTTGADPIQIGLASYPVSVALSLSAIRSRSDFGSTTCTLEVGSADNGLIDVDDLAAGFFDAAEVVIDAVDALDPSNGTTRLFDGRIGSISITDAGKASIDMRGRLYSDRSLSVQKYTPHCRTDLGSPDRCKVDLTDFTQAGVVASVVSPYEIEVSITGTSRADGWFAWGTLQWVTGRNAGLMVEVRGWVQSTSRLTLMMPTYGVIEEGDTFLVTAGCDKRLSTCQTKFSNQLNFRGEPHVPVIAGRALEGGGSGGEGGGGGETDLGGGWTQLQTPQWSFKFILDAECIQEVIDGAYQINGDGVYRGASNVRVLGSKPEGSIVSPYTYPYAGFPGYFRTAPVGFTVSSSYSSLKDPLLGIIPPPSLNFAGQEFNVFARVNIYTEAGVLVSSWGKYFSGSVPSEIVTADSGRIPISPGYTLVYALSMLPVAGGFPLNSFTVPDVGFALAWNL